jgi:hypothetical protein
MRRPRAVTTPSGPFKVSVVKRTARELVLTSDPPTTDYPVPPIVRIQPLAEQDDVVVRNVRQDWERTGAHVRVLARERIKPEAASDLSWNIEDEASTREVVMAIALEVRSADQAALAMVLGTVMDRCGL